LIIGVVASQVQRSGYVFQMYLPDAARAPINEGATGGFTGGLLLLSGLLVASAVATLWLRRAVALTGQH
jgi:hypothetical protein